MSTQTLSAGRAGTGSVVVTDDTTARTVNVADVGVVTTASSGGGGTANAVRVMVLA
jgi:hypothetical protein